MKSVGHICHERKNEWHSKKNRFSLAAEHFLLPYGATDHFQLKAISFE